MKYLVKALTNIVASKLEISQKQKKTVNDQKGIGIYPMDPLDFLKLSTNLLYIHGLCIESTS